MSSPLVSCIMPTRNRRRFVGQAVWYFVRQDYRSAELIVVDDGEDSVEDLMPADRRVRYVRLDDRLTIGAKRNLACGMARGSLIAHWDDDDWIAPHRLRVQVAALLSSGADAAGSADLLYYDLRAGRAWRYRPLAGDRAWLAGCTLVYRRTAWASNRFPEIDDGEDAAFVARLGPDRVLPMADGGTYVALLHGANAGRKNLRDPRWEPRPLDDVARLIERDRSFYSALRIGRQPPARLGHPTGFATSRSTGHDRVTVAAPFMVYDGYGSMSEYLALGMSRAGAAVDVVPITLDRSGLTEEFCALLARSRPEPGSPALYSGPVGAELTRLASPDTFVHTMWESDRFPTDWVRRLAGVRAVIVPSTFLVKVLRESGVSAPVEVVPDGVDPDVYRFVDTPQREGLTALIVGTPVGRKHIEEAVAAWQLAFSDDPEARLIVKSRFGMAPVLPADPMIELSNENQATRGIADWYRRSDVLLALGNEGFGLPMVEAMACGLPVIALDSEGQADVCREARHLILPVRPDGWEPFDEPPYGRCGLRAVPSVKEAADRLRWVASHRDEARDMGRAASAWALRHRSVWDKGPGVLAAMEPHLRAPRSLRRVASMLVPSLGSRCGIAEYGRDLAAAIGAPVRLASAWPAPPGLRVLHVQHEDGIVDDDEMERRIPQLVGKGVRIAVTEHSVGIQPRAWERDADALVALTGRGAAALRGRWPGKVVELIPHGCHTWFPPRKRSRGRVVGAFGFLEHHKGFDRLLDVLRQLPGTELLLFSYSKRSDDDWWTRLSAGLPVRRVARFLPAHEVAMRLAAEADVLAFWYDPVPGASASGAITIGLATGVPVLASPTAWFEDLRDVTYQPNDLVAGVEQLLEDTQLRKRLEDASREHCHEHSWPRVARRHEALWQRLEAA